MMIFWLIFALLQGFFAGFWVSVMVHRGFSWYRLFWFLFALAFLGYDIFKLVTL